MKSLIINAYSVRNAGDAAIMLATSKLMNQYFGSTNVSISSRHHIEDAEFYKDYGLDSCPPLIDFPSRGSLSNGTRIFRLILSVIISAIIACLYRLMPQTTRLIAQQLKMSAMIAAFDSTFIVLAGGGYLYSARRRVNLTLIHVCFQIRIAGMMGKPIIMMPQSIEPLTKSFDRKLVSWALSPLRIIVARDAESVETCKKELRLSQMVSLAPDIVFIGLPEPTKQGLTPIVSFRPDVLIVAMDWTWARNVGNEALDRYITASARTINSLVKSGARVVIAGNSRMPEQGQDDFEVARRIFALISPDDHQNVMLMPDDTDMETLRGTMRLATIVVGTRLHSCILALIESTPTVSLAYQPKTLGTYRLLGLEEYCFDVEAFTPGDLAEKAISMLAEPDIEIAKVVEAVSKARAQILDLYENLGMSKDDKA